MEPILIDVPPELHTERLYLRVPRPGDGAVINPAVVESAKELALWMPWAKPTPTVEDTEKWVRHAAAKFLVRDQFHFLIFLKDQRTYLGTCGLHHFDSKVPSAEVGYWLRTSSCGNGYMHEAVRAVSHFAFEHLKVRRLQLRCDPKNPRSAAVAKRAGFELEGVMRHDSRGTDDQIRDTCLFSRIV